MKAKARLVALLSRSGAAGTDAVRAASPETSPRVPGSGAPSGRLRLALLVLSAAAFLAIPASQASAELVVNLDGSGAGEVTSSPVGIECSNVGGGAPGPFCSGNFPLNFSDPIDLTATAGPDSYFVEWTGDDIDGFGRATCNSGDLNPCQTDDYEEFVPGTVTTITATFDSRTPIPVSTGAASAGAGDHLRTLNGTVNPEGVEVDECRFEYGPTEQYGTSTPCVEVVGEGTTAVDVSASTAPLEPQTTYHYRLVASGATTLGTGPDRTFTTGAVASSGCPNEARREEQGIIALLLPDCMALEQATPTQKSGSSATDPGLSADGARISFRSSGVFGDPPGMPFGENPGTYVASRGADAWSTESTAPDADPRMNHIWSSDADPSFSPDFSRWFGIGVSEAEGDRGIARAYEAGLGRFFSPLSGAVPAFSVTGGSPTSVANKAIFQAASSDHSHLYFKPGGRATFMPDDPRPGAENTNVYLAKRGAGGPAPLELLQRDREGREWGERCGAQIGGIGDKTGKRNQGAVSTDGRRTYLSTRPSQPAEDACDPAANKLRILERVETAAGPVISPLYTSECSRPAPEECSEADGDDLYQGASTDQSKVYFTTNRQLADSDKDVGSSCSGLEPKLGCDLYLYDRSRPAGDRLVQVSAGEDASPGEGARVFNGVTAISADGSHVYFVAGGVLTEGANPVGDEAAPFQPNLYLWDAGSEEISFVGTLAGAVSLEDLGDAIFPEGGAIGLWGGQGTWRNNAYPVPATGEGHTLLFQSKAELTPTDGDGRRLDVYRYDSEAEPPTLECLSCAPGSSEAAPDEAPFGVEPRGERVTTPLGTDFAESGRWASEDGETVGFVTDQPLLPGDVDEAIDGYIWHEGGLTQLPGIPFGADFDAPPDITGPFLSHDGSSVAFATTTALLPSDKDSIGDVYVARAGGGYPFPEPEDVCDPGEESCQEGQAAPAPLPAGAAAVPGNVRPNPCARPARRAQNLSKRAKRGRGNARRLARNGKRGQARRLHRRASRLAKAARRTSNRAKRCRRARQGQRANTNRRAGK